MVVIIRNYSAENIMLNTSFSIFSSKVLYMNIILLSKLAHLIKDIDQLVYATLKSKMLEDTQTTLTDIIFRKQMLWSCIRSLFCFVDLLWFFLCSQGCVEFVFFVKIIIIIIFIFSKKRKIWIHRLVVGCLTFSGWFIYNYLLINVLAIYILSFFKKTA